MKRRGFLATVTAGLAALLTGWLPVAPKKKEWRDYAREHSRGFITPEGKTITTADKMRVIYCPKNGMWYTIDEDKTMYWFDTLPDALNAVPESNWIR